LDKEEVTIPKHRNTHIGVFIKEIDHLEYYSKSLLNKPKPKVNLRKKSKIDFEKI